MTSAWQRTGMFSKEDRLIRDRLGYPWRGGEMMQPWYIEKYYQEELKQRRNVKNVFHFVIEELPEGLELAVEAEEHTEVRLERHTAEKRGRFLDRYGLLEVPCREVLPERGRKRDHSHLFLWKRQRSGGHLPAGRFRSEALRKRRGGEGSSHQPSG